MAKQQTNVSDDVSAVLENQLCRMNFYRFCQILEQIHPGKRLGVTESPDDDPLRFAPAPDMAFPAGELKCIERHPYLPRPPTVRTTFFGLYGVDAVLPYAFLEDIVKRQEGHEVVMDFLDMFNHRVLTQYYRIWLKYHYPASYLPAGRDPISRCLLSLTGLGIAGTENVVGTPASRFLAMLGIVTQKNRTAEGVAGVIKTLLSQVDVRVDEFYPVWVTLSNPITLSRAQPPCLGKRSVLGRRVRDANHTIKITLIVKMAHGIETVLPGAQGYEDMMKLLRLYLGYRVDAHVFLRIQRRFLPRAHLGRQQSGRLGQTTTFAPRCGHHDTGYVTVCLGQYRGLN